MSFKYCLPGIFIFAFLFLACKKTFVEPKIENEFLSPPPPLCLTGTCNVTDAGSFYSLFAHPLGDYKGELHYEFSGQLGPYNFVYDQSNNPISCQGWGDYVCYIKNHNSSFTYTNGKLSQIFIDHTYTGASCPQYMFLPTIHTATRIDFTYTFKAEQVGGFTILTPITNAIVYKSDTVPLGQNFTSFTPTGRTYYYEYNIGGTRLKIKRFKDNASSLPKEFSYTYDSVGRLTKTSMFENGIEKYRTTFYGFDGKRNFASGSPITRLLTSSYGNNNPLHWNTINYPSSTTTFFDVNYLYNSYCYPVVANWNLNGDAEPPLNISYGCQ